MAKGRDDCTTTRCSSFVLAGSRWSGPSRGGRHSTTGYNRSILQTHEDLNLNEDCVILPIIVTQDAAQVDGNGRKSLTPMYATFGVIRSAERNMEWARVLIGYIPHPNKNKRPRDRFDTDWKRYKKSVFRRAMRYMLGAVREFCQTGVRMELRGRDGELREMTVIPVIAFGSYDNPEMHKVTGVKDFYRGSPAMCTM